MVLATLLAGCGGGDDAELGSGGLEDSTSSTVPGAPTAPSDQPGPDAPAPGPAPGEPGPAPGPSPSPTSPPAPAPPPSELARVQLRLTRIASFDEPLAMAVRSGDGALYVAEKRGRVRAVRGAAVDPTPVLDIAADVSTGTEQGLLGLAFSGDGGRLYVNYTDKGGDTRIVEFAMAGGAADPATRREVLFVEQPFANNNGGQLVWGPDGRLWIGLGDGGGAGDPADNAQSLATLLGKILRIDPRPSGNLPYGVPSDNPLVGTGSRPEIWAYGLRNPRRVSVDRATGDLWIGDVGQGSREEIDFQPAGAGGGQNYGWPRLEGSKTYSGRPPGSAVPPVYDYGRSGGNCGVTGGYVYRGSRIPGLGGAYVFADYCVGQLRAIRLADGRVVDERAFSATTRFLSGFGQDLGGELYALSQEGGVFRVDAG